MVYLLFALSGLLIGLVIGLFFSISLLKVV